MAEQTIDTVPLKEHLVLRLETLERHSKEIRSEQEKRLSDLSVATDKAISAALLAAEKAVNAALASADKAASLLAVSTDERMKAHNGFIEKMQRYEALFATIASLNELKEEHNKLRLMVEKREAFYPAIGALITGIVAIALALVQFFTK